LLIFAHFCSNDLAGFARYREKRSVFGQRFFLNFFMMSVRMDACDVLVAWKVADAIFGLCVHALALLDVLFCKDAKAISVLTLSCVGTPGKGGRPLFFKKLKNFS
jgi:hypothetical protein